MYTSIGLIWSTEQVQQLWTCFTFLEPDSIWVASTPGYIPTVMTFEDVRLWHLCYFLWMSKNWYSNKWNTFLVSCAERRRVSSVVEHSSANPKVPGSIPGPVSYRGHGLWWGMFCASYSWSGPQLPKGCGCLGFLSPMHKKIPDSYSKREGGNPGNSGLLSQQ